MPIAQTRVLNALTENGGTYEGISALARAASPNRYVSNIQRHAAAVHSLAASGLVTLDMSATPYIIAAVTA